MHGQHLRGGWTEQLQPPPSILVGASVLELPLREREVGGGWQRGSRTQVVTLASKEWCQATWGGGLLKEKRPLRHPNHRFGGDWGEKTVNAAVGRVSQRAPQPHLACLGPSRLLRAVLVLISTKRWISGEGESAAPSQGSRPVAFPRRSPRTETN